MPSKQNMTAKLQNTKHVKESAQFKPYTSTNISMLVNAKHFTQFKPKREWTYADVNMQTEEKESTTSPLATPLVAQNRTVTLNELSHVITEYWVPQVWPTPKEQRGQCCGLYALDIALQYSGQKNSSPPARKDQQKDTVSLREVAKQKDFTVFGEMFNVFNLQKLAEYFQFNGCNTYIPKINYIESIKFLITCGYSVIAACDLKDSTHFPGPNQGLKTHLALIFGYINDSNEDFFLVTQFGKYYLWSATDLLKSNEEMPLKNPRAWPYYYYFKDSAKEEHFDQANSEAKIPENAKFVSIPELDNFRFGLVAVPSTEMKKCVKLSIDLVNTNTPFLLKK